MALTVEHATEDDIPAWLTLAKEVGELFGADIASDPDFRKWLVKNISRGAAYCIRIDGTLAGAMQFRHDQINWLAVGKKFQRRGVGRALVAYTIANCVNEVRVITFGENHPHPDAGAARELYARAGFIIADESVKAVSDGTPRDVFMWHNNRG